MDLPIHLRELMALLLNTFPHGVPKHDYEPLLTIMTGHMCDENVALIARELTGRTFGESLNDVYVARAELGKHDVTELIQRLEVTGVVTWLRSNE